jgi:hypothetical protein
MSAIETLTKILGQARSSPAARSLARGAATLGFAGLLVGCGWAVAAGHARPLLIAFAALALCLLALGQRGVFVGILLLAAMDGLPYFDTSSFVTSKFTIADISIFALLAVATMWILSERDSYRPTRLARAISLAGVPLLVWWMWTVVRTLNDQDGPLTRAASFGRDFAFFAILLIVLPWVRLRGRDLGALIGVLGVGACVFAVGQIMVATGAGHPGSAIHFNFTLAESGLTRVYANMTDLVTAGLAVSVAASLLAQKRRTRLIAAPVALLLTTSTILQLTRARWIGLVVALLLVGLWLTLNRDALARAVRRRLMLATGTIGLAGAIALLATPALSKGTIIHRLSSVVTTLQTGGGTVAIRESVTSRMTAYLGEHWVSGLGFVSPTSHYFFGLPLGSIRDSDLGVLNSVMTMGVVGTTLVYLPVFLVLICLLARAPRQTQLQYGWLRYAGVIWIVTTLLSSVTLITLFSPSGLALTAVFLTVLANRNVLGATRPETVTDSAITGSGGHERAPTLMTRPRSSVHLV